MASGTCYTATGQNLIAWRSGDLFNSDGSWTGLTIVLNGVNYTIGTVFPNNETLQLTTNYTGAISQTTPWSVGSSGGSGGGGGGGTPSGIQDMVTELERRVTQLDDPHALAAINRAIEWISRQGSFNFFMTGSITLTPTVPSLPDQPGIDGPVTGVALPDDVDTGKAMFVANINGVVIHKKGIQDLWESYARNIPANIGYDCYHVQGRNLLLRPGTFTPTAVGVRYCPLFAPYLITDDSPLPTEFTSLIIDYAEAEEKRINDVGDDWQTLFARCQDQIKVMLDGYRVTSLQEMTLTDAQEAAEEKTKLGRA